MKSTIGFALASAALVTAQANYNETTGEYLCEQPDAAYCAGDSLGTDIIIRCTGTKGQPGRCGNNLAGYPPLGVQPARCWQSSESAGDAACEKNCIVYAPSKSWTLPSSVCTPYYTATSSASTDAEPTTTITFINPGTASTSSKSSYPTTHKTDTTVTVTTCSEETGITTSTTKTPSTYTPTHNITGTPTTTKPTGQPPVTAGGAANKAAGALALVGLVAAWMV